MLSCVDCAGVPGTIFLRSADARHHLKILGSLKYHQVRDAERIKSIIIHLPRYHNSLSVWCVWLPQYKGNV